MDTLEKLLSQPLRAIVDNGFSLQVLEKINRYQVLRFRILCALNCLLTCIFLIFFPIKKLIENSVTYVITYSQTIGQWLLPTTYAELTTKNISISQLMQDPLTLCIIMTLTCLFFVLLLDNKRLI